MRKKIFNLASIVFSLILIFNLSRSVWRLRGAGQRIWDLESDVARSEEEKAALLGKLEWVRTDEFLEQEARDKLQMIKPGEKIVVLPQPPAVGNRPSAVEEGEGEEKRIAVWRQWLELFDF